MTEEMRAVIDGMIARGFEIGSKPMPNGEVRDRLMFGGTGYIRTEMSDNREGGWQNSHYHVGVLETYIVERGWIGYAVLAPNGRPLFSAYEPGGVFTTRTGQSHNIYMPCGAIIHTVKHGDVSGETDWRGSPELDALTKSVGEIELLRLAGKMR